MFFVCFDDHLNKLVADDVLFGEIAEVDAFDVVENANGFFEAAFLAAGQVDLCNVAGDDGL